MGRVLIHRQLSHLEVQTGLSLGEAFLCRSVTPVAGVCFRVMIRMAMRAPLFASLFFIVELFSGAAAQQKSPVIPLPEVSPCQERRSPRFSGAGKRASSVWRWLVGRTLPSPLLQLLSTASLLRLPQLVGRLLIPPPLARNVAVQTVPSHRGAIFMRVAASGSNIAMRAFTIERWIRTAMRSYQVAILVFIAMLFGGAASAQQKSPLIPLPELSPCQDASHPRLPEKWHAVFLMVPFTNAQLVLSDITYDASLPALRVKLYGLRNGSLDLFITHSDTYVLNSRDGGLSTCAGLGDTGLRPLPADWLSSQSQCVGSAPLGKTEVQWWKTPLKPAPSSYWIWYKASDQTPFRLAFQSPSYQLGVLSRYALSYQLRFEPNPDSQLESVSRACQNAKRVA